jgi:hypothetical protein
MGLPRLVRYTLTHLTARPSGSAVVHDLEDPVVVSSPSFVLLGQISNTDIHMLRKTTPALECPRLPVAITHVTKVSVTQRMLVVVLASPLTLSPELPQGAFVSDLPAGDAKAVVLGQ